MSGGNDADGEEASKAIVARQTLKQKTGDMIVGWLLSQLPHVSVPPISGYKDEVAYTPTSDEVLRFVHMSWK